MNVLQIGLYHHILLLLVDDADKVWHSLAATRFEVALNLNRFSIVAVYDYQLVHHTTVAFKSLLYHLECFLARVNLICRQFE